MRVYAPLTGRNLGKRGPGCEARQQPTWPFFSMRRQGLNTPLILCIQYPNVKPGSLLALAIAYLLTLPFDAIQHASSDRVGTATLQAIFPGTGTALMAGAIMISTFGTINALILTGSRAYYAMARQKLFFRFGGELNCAGVPAYSLWIQALWAMVLALPRTYNPSTGLWGNVYSNLLDYVISAALIFYVLTVAAVFRRRAKRPEAPRPYRALGYPFVPGAYIAGAAIILIVLFVYRPATTWPGLIIVLGGIPVYLLIGWAGRRTGPA
jgi:APA family basic amino acid/polyamine antiporter